MTRPDAVTRGEVARGAGLAGLARMGALIEAAAQPLFIWLYGLATYGIYVVLWGAVNLVSNLIDLSMTNALQRLVPAGGEAEAHAMVKLAMIVALVPAIVIASIVSLHADTVAAILAAAPEDRAALPDAIRLFVWALPLWTFIEVATAAARARRAFGPEIRLRILWEQVARIAFALLFFAIGMRSYGLAAAHLGSLLLTAMLCVPLLRRYYDLSLLARAPIGRRLARSLIGTGLALLPSSASRRLLIDAPPVALNIMLSGAAGATAAGLFEVARKISTVPLIVRQSLQYALGPLSAAQAGADRAAIAPLYRFATRVSAALIVPLAGLLIFAAPDILSIYKREAMAALPLLVILVAARAAETVAGPASVVVDMTGHRGLPLLNAFAGTLVWAGLSWWLVPLYGAVGMAAAVSAAGVVIALSAVIELRITEGISPLERRLFATFAIGAGAWAAMALAADLANGPARFAAVLLLWLGSSWLTLRHGLDPADRAALGPAGRRLRLAPEKRLIAGS